MIWPAACKPLAELEAAGQVVDHGSARKPPAAPIARRGKARKPQGPLPCGWQIKLIVPVKVKSEANQRCHWLVRWKRFEAQARQLSASLQLAWLHEWIPDLPILVTFTHVGRKMDTDNLAGAFKGLRDALAGHFDVSDGDERIEWKYDQRQGCGGIEIVIESKP